MHAVVIRLAAAIQRYRPLAAITSHTAAREAYLVASYVVADFPAATRALGGYHLLDAACGVSAAFAAADEEGRAAQLAYAAQHLDAFDAWRAEQERALATGDEPFTPNVTRPRAPTAHTHCVECGLPLAAHAYACGADLVALSDGAPELADMLALRANADLEALLADRTWGIEPAQAQAYAVGGAL